MTTACITSSPSIVGKIIDSAFTCLTDLCKDIAVSSDLPSVFIPAVISVLKSKVVKKANFDFSSISPLKSVSNNFVPIIFGHAIHDQFIPFHHSQQLFNASRSSEKQLIVLEGGHNSIRSIEWIQNCVGFILNQFGIQFHYGDLVLSNSPLKSATTDFHFSSFSQLVDNSPDITEKRNHSTSPEKKSKSRNKKKEKKSEDADCGY